MAKGDVESKLEILREEISQLEQADVLPRDKQSVQTLLSNLKAIYGVLNANVKNSADAANLLERNLTDLVDKINSAKPSDDPLLSANLNNVKYAFIDLNTALQKEGLRTSQSANVKSRPARPPRNTAKNQSNAPKISPQTNSSSESSSRHKSHAVSHGHHRHHGHHNREENREKRRPQKDPTTGKSIQRSKRTSENYPPPVNPVMTQHPQIPVPKTTEAKPFQTQSSANQAMLKTSLSSSSLQSNTHSITSLKSQPAERAPTQVVLPTSSSSSSVLTSSSKTSTESLPKATEAKGSPSMWRNLWNTITGSKSEAKVKVSTSSSMKIMQNLSEKENKEFAADPMKFCEEKIKMNGDKLAREVTFLRHEIDKLDNYIAGQVNVGDLINPKVVELFIDEIKKAKENLNQSAKDSYLTANKQLFFLIQVQPSDKISKADKKEMQTKVEKLSHTTLTSIEKDYAKAVGEAQESEKKALELAKPRADTQPSLHERNQLRKL